MHSYFSRTLPMRNKLVIYLMILCIVQSSCRTAAYFDTPNSLRNMRGEIFLVNGRSYKGRIVINNTGTVSNTIKLYEDGEKRPMRFSIQDVKGYQLEQDYFALKEIRGGLKLGRTYYFMKRLTPVNSRMHLYENREKRSTSNSRNLNTVSYETTYYVQLPGDHESFVWPLHGSKFVPAFDEKMSRVVADCPSLSRKITNRMDGYFYAQVTVFSEKRADVMMKIIEEYNACR